MNWKHCLLGLIKIMYLVECALVSCTRVSSSGNQRADAKAGQSLRRAQHMHVGFVTSWLFLLSFSSSSFTVMYQERVQGFARTLHPLF